MDLFLAKGGKVIIELKNKRMFKGNLLKSAKSEIHLGNVIEYAEHVKLVSAYMVFHQSAIKSMKILLQESTPTEKPDSSITGRKGECERLMVVPAGQRIVIELKLNQIFEGDLQKATKTRIDVINVVEHPERIKLRRDCVSFFEIEIISVKILLQELPDTGKLLSNIIAIERKEYDRLMNVADQYIYITEKGQRYFAAIEDLNFSESIGVVALWSNSSQFRSLAALAISTLHHVYIFDLKSFDLPTFPSELKAILESEYPEKVAHDSTALVDWLTYIYKLKLKNFSDTQMADVKIQTHVTGRTPQKYRNLSECVAQYFNFPGSFLTKALDMPAEDWEQRPLNDVLKHKAAQLATYLISLKDKQKTILLKDCFDAVEAGSQGLLHFAMVHKSSK